MALIRRKDVGQAWETEVDTGGGSLPSGGTTGEVLTKLSNADGDADWEPGGGSQPLPLSVCYLEMNTPKANAETFTWDKVYNSAGVEIADFPAEMGLEFDLQHGVINATEQGLWLIELVYYVNQDATAKVAATIAIEGDVSGGPTHIFPDASSNFWGGEDTMSTFAYLTAAQFFSVNGHVEGATAPAYNLTDYANLKLARIG